MLLAFVWNCALGGFCLLASAVPVQSAQVENASSTDLSRIPREIISKNKVPGMAVCVVTSDRIVATGVAGVRKKGDPAAVTITDPFHLGSCTKAMTATLCARSVHQGQFDWSLSIGSAFPELETLHPEFAEITLAALLSNHGRFPGDVEAKLWGELFRLQSDPVAARRRLTEALTQVPPTLEKDKYQYSNAGFAVAGHMLETRVGQPYEQLMKRDLFGPLGMESAGFGAPAAKGATNGDAKKAPFVPWGHTASGRAIAPGVLADNPPAIAPAGTVHASITDWAKFVQLHLRVARGEEKTFEGLAVLHRPYVSDGSNYAMGWVRTSRAWAKTKGNGKPPVEGDAPDADGNVEKSTRSGWDSGDVLTHSGSNTFWFAVTWIAPGQDLAVLITCNQGGDSAARACDQAAWELIQWALKRGAQPSGRPQSQPGKPKSR